jgi:hypothetical protein
VGLVHMGFEVAGTSKVETRRLIRLPDKLCLSVGVGHCDASSVT